MTKTIVKNMPEVKSIFDKVASWPQLLSYLLVAPACLHAASDWPHTFYTQRVFV